jgi:hypothetical protein
MSGEVVLVMKIGKERGVEEKRWLLHEMAHRPLGWLRVGF